MKFQTFKFVSLLGPSAYWTSWGRGTFCSFNLNSISRKNWKKNEEKRNYELETNISKFQFTNLI